MQSLQQKHTYSLKVDIKKNHQVSLKPSEAWKSEHNGQTTVFKTYEIKPELVF